MASVTDNDELVASLYQVKTTTPDFKFQGVPSHFRINVRLFSANDAAFCSGLGSKDLIEPVAINLDGAKKAHGAIFARFRLMTD